MTFRLVYRSRSELGSSERGPALAEIFSTARSSNKKLGVTGALLLTDHYFVQTLEGEESVVRGLYERIARDPRHGQLELLDGRDVDARAFSRWAMAEVSKSGGADIPLIVEGSGVATAAARSTTPEQDAVLTTMRNAIGADTV